MLALIPLVVVLTQVPPQAGPPTVQLCEDQNPADSPQADMQRTIFGSTYCDTLARLQPVLRVGGNIKAPIKTKDVRPAYPADAQQAGIQGVVILELLLDVDGKVANGRILRSIPMLDESSMRAVSQWEYTPVLLNGNPMPTAVTVTVNYTMQ